MKRKITKRKIAKRVSPIVKLKRSRDPMKFIAGVISKSVKRFEAKDCSDEEAFPLPTLLRKFGFRKKQGDGLSGPIFINNEIGLVVKRPYLCADDPVELPPRAIPTEIIPVNDDTSAGDEEFQDHGPYIFIQPLADVSYKARNKAYKLLRKCFGLYDEDDGGSEFFDDDDVPDCPTDMHSGNVAMWKGQAVRIDW